MAKSRERKVMEGDIKDMRKLIEECRERAETATADALSLQGQIDNYETLLARASDYKPGSDEDEDEDECDDDEQDEPEQPDPTEGAPSY